LKQEHTCIKGIVAVALLFLAEGWEQREEFIMLPKQTWGWFAGLSLMLLLVMLWIAWRPPTPPNIGFENPAAVLAIATAGAVAIERIIEIIWTIIGSTKGSFWPLNVVGQQIDRFVSTFDATLVPFYKEAEETIDQVA
jgi:predicted benzoate:H+ symporter BenE